MSIFTGVGSSVSLNPSEDIFGNYLEKARSEVSAAQNMPVRLQPVVRLPPAPLPVPDAVNNPALDELPLPPEGITSKDMSEPEDSMLAPSKPLENQPMELINIIGGNMAFRLDFSAYISFMNMNKKHRNIYLENIRHFSASHANNPSRFLPIPFLHDAAPEVPALREEILGFFDHLSTSVPPRTHNVPKYIARVIRSIDATMTTVFSRKHTYSYLQDIQQAKSYRNMLGNYIKFLHLLDGIANFNLSATTLNDPQLKSFFDKAINQSIEDTSGRSLLSLGYLVKFADTLPREGIQDQSPFAGNSHAILTKILTAHAHPLLWAMLTPNHELYELRKSTYSGFPSEDNLSSLIFNHHEPHNRRMVELIVDNPSLLKDKTLYIRTYSALEIGDERLIQALRTPNHPWRTMSDKVYKRIEDAFKIRNEIHIRNTIKPDSDILEIKDQDYSRYIGVIKSGNSKFIIYFHNNFNYFMNRVSDKEYRVSDKEFSRVKRTFLANDNRFNENYIKNKDFLLSTSKEIFNRIVDAFWTKNPHFAKLILVPDSPLHSMQEWDFEKIVEAFQDTKIAEIEYHLQRFGLSRPN
jgi:hypothetical protein